MSLLHRSEFERRAELVRELAVAAGYDALIAYSVGNLHGPVAYLGGYEPSFGLNDVAFVVLVAHPMARETLITNSYWDDVEGQTWIDDVVVTKRGHAQVIADHLPRPCRRVGVVGYDFFPAPILNALATSMAGTSFEDATELVQGVAKIKSPAEIELVRRAAQVTDAGGQGFLGSLTDGQSERAVQEAVDHAMMAAGADGVAFPTFVMTGPRIATGIGFAADRRLAIGDQVNVLCGAQIGGYRVELGRVSTVDRPPADDLLRVMEAAADMSDAMRERMGPGVAVGAVADAAMEAARRSSMEAHVWAPVESPRFFGHGMGCWVSEPPNIEEHGSALLQPGMIMSVEARLSIPGHGGAVITEMVLIDPNGSTRLSTMPLRTWQ